MKLKKAPTPGWRSGETERVGQLRPLVGRRRVVGRVRRVDVSAITGGSVLRRVLVAVVGGPRAHGSIVVWKPSSRYHTVTPPSPG